VNQSPVFENPFHLKNKSVKDQADGEQVD
jgi:hypothetical protein